jgi:hypothetical protein
LAFIADDASLIAISSPLRKATILNQIASSEL